MERGLTRSGRAYIKLNSPYSRSIAELKAKHRKLFSPVPAITPSLVRLLNSRALLSQITARFLFNSSLIRETLINLFTQQFREHPITSVNDPGFEVVLVSNFFD